MREGSVEDGSKYSKKLLGRYFARSRFPRSLVFRSSAEETSLLVSVELLPPIVPTLDRCVCLPSAGCFRLKLRLKL